MKKIVPVLLVVWLVIGVISFAVWWKIVRNISTQSVLVAANEIAKEMEVPWSLRFSEVKPGYGAEFKLILSNLEVLNSKGEVLLESLKSEVRIPWAIFFKKSPVKMNIFFRDITIPSTVEIVNEMEKFVDNKRSESQPRVSLPDYVINSTFNLRLSNIKGVHEGNAFTVDKIYLINADPKKPTTFEVSFPWTKSIQNNTVTGITKVLGEYRLSRQKIDLHFFAKNRINIKNDEIDKTAEITFEGKAYYGSRVGLFSTLASKEDWFGFVGDIEWTKKNFKLNFPKFSIHHDTLFDLYSLKELQNKSKGYSQSSIQGALRYKKEKLGLPLLKLSMQSKANAKVNLGGSPRPLVFVVTQRKDLNKFMMKVEDKEILSLSLKKGEGEYRLDEDFFKNDKSNKPETTISSFLRYVSWQDWRTLKVYKGDRHWFNVTKSGPNYEVTKLQLDDLPLLNLKLSNQGITEWSTRVTSQPLDNVFDFFNFTHFGIPGFRYDASMLMSGDRFHFKSLWTGNIQPILSRSSCKGLLQERSDLSFLFLDDLTHNVEFIQEKDNYKIVKWSALSPKKKVSISGSWSNNPINCHLSISEKFKNKKTSTFEVVLK